MLKLLSMFSGWHGYAAAAVLSAILASGATFYLTSLGYRLTISQMETAKATEEATAASEALKQFTERAAAIQSAADTFIAAKASLDGRFASINRNLANVIQNAPLPLDCKPDAGRVQSLSEAISAANSAAGQVTRPAVPLAK